MGYLQSNFEKSATKLLTAGRNAMTAARSAAPMRYRAVPARTPVAAPIKPMSSPARAIATSAPTKATAAATKQQPKLSSWEKLRNILALRTNSIIQNALAMTHGGIPPTMLASNPTLALTNGGLRAFASAGKYLMKAPYLF